MAPRMRRVAGKVGFGLAVGVILVAALFPFYHAFVTSMATDQGQFGLHYWPTRLDLENYRIVLGQRGFGRAALNSLAVAGVTVGGSLVLALLAAHALVRGGLRGRGLMLGSILAVSMFPQVAILAGMFELMRALGLYNTIWAVALAQTAFTLPFSVWLMTVFLRGLPVEIEEAAVIDGATPWVVVRHLHLPLLAPALAATGLLAFIGSWNEFLFALTLTISEDQRTIPVIAAMINPFAFQEAAAASILITLPAAGLVLVFQRRIVAGLTAGSLAG